MASGDDATLVAAAQRGDQTALDRLLRLHYDRIWAVCRRLAGNDADAADATQEALITIARRIDRYDGRAKFSTWVYRVATNACLDELRRRGRRPMPVLDDETTERPRADAAPGVAGQVTDRLVLDEAFDALPEDFKKAVVLRDVVGCDYAEIASILDLPPGTVRSRISRGRALLARSLGNHEAPTRRPNERP